GDRPVKLAVPDYSGVRVLIAGDAMLDEYWFGDTGRISPEAPVPVARTRTTERRPGGAGNAARNVAALGADACLVAVVGDDERGAALERMLAERGVRCGFVRSPDVPTIHKLRVLARSQQLIRLDAEQPLEACAAAAVERFEAELARADVVVLSDYGKGTLARAAALVARCREAGVPVLVDPKGTDFARYRGATALTPNRLEFEAVAGVCADEADLLARGERLRANLALDALLITRGEQGMTLFCRDREPLTLPAEAREVFRSEEHTSEL